MFKFMLAHRKRGEAIVEASNIDCTSTWKEPKSAGWIEKGWVDYVS
jgi:hypothetical protein